MNRNQHAAFQKWLLIFTGVIVMAFLVTFPTRDRRGMVDRIRLKVGADKNLVSKRTLKEIAAEEKAAGRGPKRVSDTAKLDKRALARGANSPQEQRARLEKNIAFYCNDQFNATACAQWLNSCGESCRLLVRQDLWSKMQPAQRRAIASSPVKQAVAKNRGR